MRRWFTMIDAFTGIALAMVLFSIAAAAETASVDAAKRARCASNLHLIGLALLLYEFDNHQAFPRTIGDGADSPTPVWGTPYEDQSDLKFVADANPFDDKSAARPRPNDVTATMFLLLRAEKILPMAFVCPSSGVTPFDFGGPGHHAKEWTNWPGNSAIAAH